MICNASAEPLSDNPSKPNPKNKIERITTLLQTTTFAILISEKLAQHNRVILRG